MDLSLTTEQRLVQETATRIAQETLGPIAGEIDSRNRFPREALDALARAGLMGILLPAPLGGGGGDTLSFCLATESIARQSASAALVYVTHVAAAFGLLVGANDSVKAEYLPAVASGTKLAAFAVTEPNSGSNSLAVQAAAEADGDVFVVNGSKTFITGAGEAAANLVLVRTDKAKGPAGLSLLLIDKNTPGLSFGRIDAGLGLNGTSRGEIFLDNCRVPNGNLVGSEGGGMQMSLAIGGIAVLGAAAISLGLAQAALDASIKHTKERVVAGQPIGAYEGVQFLIAQMSTSVDAIRAVLNWAVWLRDNTPPGPPLASYKAKLFASQMAIDVTNKALQVHGAHGYSKELPLERFYRDARGLTLHFGVTEALEELLGKMLLGLFP